MIVRLFHATGTAFDVNRNDFQNAPIAKTRDMGYRNNKYLWQIKAQLAGRSRSRLIRRRSSRHSNLNALPVSRHLFNSKLKFEGFTFGHFSAGSQKLDRDAGPGVLGPFSKIMGLQSLLQIVGDPTIQGLVSAPDQIDDPILVGVQVFTLSFNSLPALKKGNFFGLIFTFSPVFGFLPI